MNPFLLFLRQDLHLQVQAHLTALSILTSVFVRQMQFQFLDHFWSFFWAQFGVTFRVKTESKIGPFFWKGSCRPFGGFLGGFLAVLELSWEAWCSRFTVKTIQNSNFQNRFLSLSWPFGMAFGCHVGSFWGGFGPQNGARKTLKTDPKNGPKNDNLLEHFWAPFWAQKVNS